jgi:hypothetical protein
MKMSKLACNLAVPEEFVPAIGHVMTQWAYLEAHIRRELALLRQRPECAALIPPKDSHKFEEQIALWHKMSDAVYPTEKDRADTHYIHQNATSIKGERDELAHNPLGASELNVVMLRQKKGKIVGVEEFSDGVARVIRVAKRISEINSRCISYEARHQ